MRFCFFVLFEVALAGLVISCRSSSSGIDKNAVSSVRFSQTFYYFGEISYDSDGKCEFEFLNTSDVPLIITSVKASCGCTAVGYPKKPISPGKKGVISIEYNTQIEGNFHKSITVNSNASNSPAVLFISGNVLSKSQQP